MALPRVTGNQVIALHRCVSGDLRGRYLASVPSLLKRGFLREVEVETMDWRLGTPTMVKRKQYRLTEEGLRIYLFHRRKSYETRRDALMAEFERDIAMAKAQARA